MLRKNGFDCHIHIFGWHDKTKSFEVKLQLLVDIITDQLSKYSKISLIGMSAGGSAVINAAFQQPQIYKAITICSRLSTIPGFGLDLNFFGRFLPTYQTSVQQAESQLHSSENRLDQKSLVLRPIWDEIVPIESTQTPKLATQTLPTVSHLLGILWAFTLSKRVILDFLND